MLVTSALSYNKSTVAGFLDRQLIEPMDTHMVVRLCVHGWGCGAHRSVAEKGEVAPSPACWWLGLDATFL